MYKKSQNHAVSVDLIVTTITFVVTNFNSNTEQSIITPIHIIIVPSITPMVTERIAIETIGK